MRLRDRVTHAGHVHPSAPCSHLNVAVRDAKTYCRIYSKAAVRRAMKGLDAAVVSMSFARYCWHDVLVLERHDTVLDTIRAFHFGVWKQTDLDDRMSSLRRALSVGSSVM